MPDVISQPGGAGHAREGSGPKQSADRHAPNFEPTEDEKTVVGNWQTRVTRAEDKQATKTWRENLEKLRRYERGEQTVDDKKSRTNMVYATIAAQMPELYARNPTIAVTPSDAVTRAEMGKVKKFSATAERVIRKMLVEEGKLKKRAKSNIRSTCVTSFGVLKVLYQKEYRGDPVAVRRIEDSQDNLARVEALIRQMKKTDDPAELAEKRDTLRANLQAIASGNEVKIFKGFLVDRMKSEDFLLLDDNVAEFDEYVEARALGHKIWMTVAQARQLFQLEPIGATRYGRPRTDHTKGTDDTPADEQFICVIEAWDKENGVVRTFAKGMNRWLREPYAPQCVPQRWYPFYVLGFNLTEGDWRPLSDVELLLSLQDEYDRTRQNYADVREKAVPVRVGRKGGNLSEQDVKNLVQAKNGDWVFVEGNPAQPIGQDVMQLDGLKIDPAAYDVSMIRNDMDLVTGRSDASRANLIKPKTATEAEIMAEAMQSRVGERRDTHEDLLSEMGEACLEVALRELTKDEVRQIAGEDAEWPENPETVETIFRQVIVKVRAGSSGRPNMQREREQWLQLMPVIKETMQAVTELRAAGDYQNAEAALALLRETLRRFDENLDLDAYIPPMETDANGQPVAAQQAAQQVVQLKEALTQCQEELAACQEALAKAQQAEQAKAIEAKTKDDAMRAEQARKDEESRAKLAADEAERARKAKLEDEEIARRERLEMDARERAEREGKAKLEHEGRVKVESEKIRAGATAEEKAAKDRTEQHFAQSEQLTAQLLQTMQALLTEIGALREDMGDFMDAPREVQYGEDGMPTGVKVHRKKKPAQKAPKETIQ